MPKTNLIIIAFVAVGVLTASLTFLFLFLNAEPDLPDLYGKNTIAAINNGPETPVIGDFLNPDLNLYNQQPRYYLFRKKLDNWEKIQVKQYWIDPKTIIIDILTRKTDKQMEDFLEKIP